MATNKQRMAEESMKIAERQAREQVMAETQTNALQSKVSKSTQMFKNTKINSCKSILAKNGQNVCIAFANGAPCIIPKESVHNPEGYLRRLVAVIFEMT